jgi:hypothetical protein
MHEEETRMYSKRRSGFVVTFYGSSQEWKANPVCRQRGRVPYREPPSPSRKGAQTNSLCDLVLGS